MSTSLKYGLTSGVLIAIVNIVMHYVNFELSRSITLGMIFFFVLPIIVTVLATLAERKKNDGLLSFGEGLKTCFIVIFLYTLIVVVSEHLHYQTFSDETWNKIILLDKENEASMMTFFGDDALVIDEALDSEDFTLEKFKDNHLSISVLMIGLLSAALFGLIISAIIAGILKRNPKA